MSKFFKNHKKDFIMWGLVLLIFGLIFLIVYFENKDKEHYFNVACNSDINIVDDEINFNKNYYLDPNGNVVSNNLWSIGNGYTYNSEYGGNWYNFGANNDSFQSVSSNTTYTISYNVTKQQFIKYYDSSKNFLSDSGQYISNSKTFTTPNNCAYILVVCIGTSSNVEIMLNTGSSALPYEPYGTWYSNPMNNSVFSPNWNIGTFEYWSTRQSSPYVVGSLDLLRRTTNIIYFDDLMTYIQSFYSSSWNDYGSSFEAEMVFKFDNPIILSEVVNCSFFNVVSSHNVYITLLDNSTLSLPIVFSNGSYIIQYSSYLNINSLVKSVSFYAGQPNNVDNVKGDFFTYICYDLYSVAYSLGYNNAYSDYSSDLNNELNERMSEYYNSYNELQNQYDTLNEQYNQLDSNYQSLLEQYNSLNNENYTFSELFWSLSAVPFGVLSSGFNVNVLGVNLAAIISGLFTAVLLIWIIKKFLR